MKRQFFLPLVTYPDASSDTLLASALAVAEKSRADLAVAIVETSIPPFINPWSSVLIDTHSMVLEAEHMSRMRAGELRSALESKVANSGVAVDISMVDVMLPMTEDTIAELSRVRDMSIAEARLRGLAEALIFGSGRPVLLLPETPVAGAMEKIAIAWDGSRASARALADAMPFIEAAREVNIISATDDKPSAEQSTDKLQAAMRARGISPGLHRFQLGSKPIGEALQDKAQELASDMMVMGAFGHSRLRDFVLGGATKAVLTKCRLPVLLSH